SSPCGVRQEYGSSGRPSRDTGFQPVLGAPGVQKFPLPDVQRPQGAGTGWKPVSQSASLDTVLTTAAPPAAAAALPRGTTTRTSCASAAAPRPARGAPAALPARSCRRARPAPAPLPANSAGPSCGTR